MKILYLAHRMPYPPNKGDKIRSFNEIKYLSGEHELHLSFLVDDADDLRHVPALQEYARSIDYARINPRWQKVKSVPYLLSGKPLSVPYFYSSELQEAIDRRLQQEEIDVIFCFSSPMAEYVFKSRHYGTDSFRNIRLVMDFVDVDSDKWRMYSEFASFPMSAVYRKEWRSLREYETRVANHFDESVFVSEKELELFRSFGSAGRLAVVQNGVDLEAFAVKRAAEKKKGPILIFTGAMDYYPNEDAVVYFAREILPKIRRELPSALFYIVGSKPGKKVLALAAKEGVVVTGFVPDISPYLAMADVFVAPLRIARGVQNKVLEAMAAGVPVVARPEAVQGICDHRGGIVVAESADDFARRTIEVVTQPQKRQQTVEAAKRCITEQFHWPTNLSRLGNVLAGDRSGAGA